MTPSSTMAMILSSVWRWAMAVDVPRSIIMPRPQIPATRRMLSPLHRLRPENRCRNCLIIAVLLLESGDAVAEQAVETAAGQVTQAVQGNLEKYAPVLSGIRLK